MNDKKYHEIYQLKEIVKSLKELQSKINPCQKTLAFTDYSTTYNTLEDIHITLYKEIKFFQSKLDDHLEDLTDTELKEVHDYYKQKTSN